MNDSLNLSCHSSGNANTTDVDFFDSSFTFSNESIEVGCCDRDMTLTNVTCGEGVSCIAVCSAIDASLCPSANCTEDRGDCVIHPASEVQGNGEGSSVTESAPTTGASWEFNWCLPGAT